MSVDINCKYFCVCLRKDASTYDECFRVNVYVFLIAMMLKLYHHYYYTIKQYFE